ncbi:hypothetical protein CJ030_MR1G016574 [Morella rubra]|uniref:Uncharacterized protein n=1 Tax=Morella rubra TaxID=262757 RepID=A0A6A1WMR6_9ROSI|nr:hypothetical protein CJ030_MR1G016574 [Morella rubra]
MGGGAPSASNTFLSHSPPSTGGVVVLPLVVVTILCHGTPLSVACYYCLAWLVAKNLLRHQVTLRPSAGHELVMACLWQAGMLGMGVAWAPCLVRGAGATHVLMSWLSCGAIAARYDHVMRSCCARCGSIKGALGCHWHLILHLSSHT